MSTGQVLAPEPQDLLTRHASPECEKDTPVSSSLVATALSREGSNLGAASLHCVIVSPSQRRPC